MQALLLYLKTQMHNYLLIGIETWVVLIHEITSDSLQQANIAFESQQIIFGETFESPEQNCKGNVYSYQGNTSLTSQ